MQNFLYKFYDKILHRNNKEIFILLSTGIYRLPSVTNSLATTDICFSYKKKHKKEIEILNYLSTFFF